MSKHAERAVARVEQLNQFVVHLNSSSEPLDQLYQAFSVRVGYLGYPYDLQAVYFVHQYPLLCVAMQSFLSLLVLFGLYASFRVAKDVYDNPEEYGAHDIPILCDLVPPRREGDSREARMFRKNLKKIQARATKRTDTLGEFQASDPDKDFDELLKK